MIWLWKEEEKSNNKKKKRYGINLPLTSAR